ncbi:carboxylesterase [Sagittula sp. P11]|nr:carboxylesterase [Sagittula sp. P11]
MGMIQQLAAILFGGNRNAVKELAEVFRVNAEASAERGHALDTAALSQFAAEFVARNQRTWWDSLVDGLNRLPRPAFTCGVFAVLIWTVRDPVFMSEVFTAWAIIPTPVWALITVIVTFFFGGRAQVKDFDFQRDVAGLMARTQAVMAQRDQPLPADDTAPPATTNQALLDWRAQTH